MYDSYCLKACRTSYDYLDIHMVVKPDIRFYQLLKLIKSLSYTCITQCILYALI